jgi:hypothetical protein
MNLAVSGSKFALSGSDKKDEEAYIAATRVPVSGGPASSSNKGLPVSGPRSDV